jgi:hypothetical protein
LIPDNSDDLVGFAFRVAITVRQVVGIQDSPVIWLSRLKLQLANRHELLRPLNHGRGPKEQSTDQAKHRSVGAHAKGEREHGHGREAGVFAKFAKSEAKVVKHRGSGLVIRDLLVAVMSCLTVISDTEPESRIPYHGFIHI